MSLVYIDTNVFLDFYQSATDRLTVFQEVLARSKNVILAQQTIDEFHRNRVARLLHLADEVEKSAKQQIFTTAVVQALPNFQKWREARDTSKKTGIEIANMLRSWTIDEEGDLVLSEFNKLAGAAKTVLTTNELIERAKNRNLLGHPPTTPDKYTIGDELIWESLLEGSADDIVVVSRDKSFLSNEKLLAAEYFRRTGKTLLLVTKLLSKGLERIGKGSEKIKVAEESLPAAQMEVVSEKDGIRLIRGPYGIGGGPIDLNVHSSFYCPTCGSSAWNGSRCVVCGQTCDD